MPTVAQIIHTATIVLTMWLNLIFLPKRQLQGNHFIVIIIANIASSIIIVVVRLPMYNNKGVALRHTFITY